MMLESIQAKDKAADIDILHSHLKLMKDARVDIAISPI